MLAMFRALPALVLDNPALLAPLLAVAVIAGATLLALVGKPRP